MDILFLCHRFPYPPNKGDKIRSHALLAYLAERHTVHLGCFVDDPADLAHAETVRRLAGGECLFSPLHPLTKWLRSVGALLSRQPITTAYFGSGQMRQWVKRIVETKQIECAVVFSSAMAPYLAEDSALPPARAILDMVDVDSDKWRQYAMSAPWWQSWLFLREHASLLKLEREAASRFGATLLVSPHEAECFIALAPEAASRVRVLANGVDLARFALGSYANPFVKGEIPIVMTGRMDYRPNADGALWFASRVMPLVARALPQARFYVVGANPTRPLRAAADTRVVITGQVQDVRPYLQHAAAVVAPLKMARGVQNKVLEAMAMTRPVVATPEATRALAVSAGAELWIESEPSRFAAAVVAAATGKERAQIAARGRNYVERNHDWLRNLAILDDLLVELRNGSTPQSAATSTMPQMSASHLSSERRSIAGAGR